MEIYYAFIKNSIVDNVVVFDDSATSELIEQFRLSQNADETQLIPDYFNSGIGIGATWNGVKFIPVKPLPSWVWNDEINKWEPPLKRPAGRVVWNEESQGWDTLPPT